MGIITLYAVLRRSKEEMELHARQTVAVEKFATAFEALVAKLSAPPTPEDLAAITAEMARHDAAAQAALDAAKTTTASPTPGA